MKKQAFLSLSALFAVSIVFPALAADLPSRKAAPVYAPPPPMWTGLYAGLNAGGTWANDRSIKTSGAFDYAIDGLGKEANLIVSFWRIVSLTGSQSVSNSGGFIGGGQFGYNFVSDRYLLGLEADIQGVAGGNQTGSATIRRINFSSYSPLLQTNIPNARDAISDSKKHLDYIGTTRVRLGFLPTPELMLYATGGLAFGGANLSTSNFVSAGTPRVDDISPGYKSGATTIAGWTAGGGAEWMFRAQWSAKVEYLYYDLGNMNLYGGQAIQLRNAVGPYQPAIPTGSIININSVNASSRYTGNIIRGGINYHFNWGMGPVVARF